MRSLPIVLAALALVTFGSPGVGASHVDTGEFRKGCPFSEDEWDDGVYDCGGRIPSIQNPSFLPAEEAGWLDDGDVVIGVSVNGTTRAYPISILNWHEIANDEVDGTPIVVTYCPLCGSSVVYEREVEGEVLDFHVSGYLFRSDLVMVDEQTHSLWPQIEGNAARGAFHGTSLRFFPSTTTGWSDWLEAHPETEVLERPRCGDGSTDNRGGCSQGDFQRNYNAYPYGGYESSRDAGISGQHRGDVEGIHPKDMVLGVQHQGQAKAYPFADLNELGLVNDDLEGTPLVVSWVGSDGHAFVRSSDEPFTLGPERTLVGPDGTAYDARTGKALDGSGQLEELDSVDLFWFAWMDHHPRTQVWTQNGTMQVTHTPPGRGIPGFSVPWSLVALAGIALVVAARRR